MPSQKVTEHTIAFLVQPNVRLKRKIKLDGKNGKVLNKNRMNKLLYRINKLF